MDRNYIYILEDGTVYTGKVFTEEERSAVDKGLLTVICIGDCEPKNYYSYKWSNLDQWDLQEPDE